MKNNKIKTTRKIITYLLIMVMIVSVAQGMQIRAWADTDNFETSIAAFPESYKPYLRALHTKYPKWNFVAYNTGIDFFTAVNNEASNNKSLVENSYNEYLKSRAATDYNASTGKYIAKDGSTWVSASKNTVAYFMDPRNFLNEDFITMFEQLSYDPKIHVQEGVESILKDSFMYKTTIGYLTSAGKYKYNEHLYSSRFIMAAQESKVSPYYLASKSVLEVGKGKNTKYERMGSGSSVNGQNATYPGIYNFYNIGASDGANAVTKGLEWASKPDKNEKYQRPWTDPKKSIVGGAVYIGEKFINAGQDTTYFQRFNVKSDCDYALYTHQYMTSIYGNAAESMSTSKAYKDIGIMSTEKTFIIPVYNNIPNEQATVVLGTASKTGTANAGVNMRKGPNTTSDKIITLNEGDAVTILDGVMTDVPYSVKWLNNPYWYKIQVVSGGVSYVGYVSANYIDMKSELDLVKGTTTKATVAVTNNETVYYESDNPAIATVDASGNITAKKAGTTTIMAYTACGDFSPMTVTVMDKGVVLGNTKLTINEGAKQKIAATVYPTTATNKTITWKSSDTKVAKVSSDGTITAVSAGSATITATAPVGGVTGVCKVTVIKPVKSVSLNKKSKTIAAGSTYSLKATINPTNASIKTVTWTTSNKKIATVNNGVVTGISPGKVTITVTTTNEKKTAKCTIKVIPATTTITKIKSKSYTSAKIYWNKVTDITGYRVYRKQNGSYKCIATVGPNNTSYTDKGLATGKTYKYKVAAYKDVGGVRYLAGKSKIRTVKVVPAKTKITSAKKSGKRNIKLKYKSVAGGQKYYIYRRENGIGEYKLIAKTKELTYTDTNLQKGTKYTYKIKVYGKHNGKRTYSEYSKKVSVTR